MLSESPIFSEYALKIKEKTDKYWRFGIGWSEDDGRIWPRVTILLKKVQNFQLLFKFNNS